MKTIVTTVLLAGALMTGACSRSEEPEITAAQATPEPPTATQTASMQKSEAELEAERLRQAAARAEADKLLATPTPAQFESSGPIITGPGPGPSGLVPSANFERHEPMITGPTSGIAVEVVSSSGKIIAADLKTNAKGAINVQLPGPGTYRVRYTSGPSKGKVIRTIEATEAGGVNVSIPPPSAAP